jgi:hypothetical protein
MCFAKMLALVHPIFSRRVFDIGSFLKDFVDLDQIVNFSTSQVRLVPDLRELVGVAVQHVTRCPCHLDEIIANFVEQHNLFRLLHERPTERARIERTFAGWSKGNGVM